MKFGCQQSIVHLRGTWGGHSPKFHTGNSLIETRPLAKTCVELKLRGFVCHPRVRLRFKLGPSTNPEDSLAEMFA